MKLFVLCAEYCERSSYQAQKYRHSKEKPAAFRFQQLRPVEQAGWQRDRLDEKHGQCSIQLNP
jgi:hypothetical protein